MQASASSSTSTSTPSSSRLSIYDHASAPIILIPEAPTQLQLQISSVRKATQSLYGDLSSKLRNTSNKWIGAEHKFEHELSSIRARDEALTPGAFYVGISTLFGSILTRNRLFPIRILTPPAFLVASSLYFLPKNTHNTLNYIEDLEGAYAPSLLEAQRSVGRHINAGLKQIEGYTVQGRKQLESLVSQSKTQIQNTTGLNVGNTTSTSSTSSPSSSTTPTGPRI